MRNTKREIAPQACLLDRGGGGRRIAAHIAKVSELVRKPQPIAATPIARPVSRARSYNPDRKAAQHGRAFERIGITIVRVRQATVRVRHGRVRRALVHAGMGNDRCAAGLPRVFAVASEVPASNKAPETAIHVDLVIVPSPSRSCAPPPE
jgi:hypothetical protein